MWNVEPSHGSRTPNNKSVDWQAPHFDKPTGVLGIENRSNLDAHTAPGQLQRRPYVLLLLPENPSLRSFSTRLWHTAPKRARNGSARSDSIRINEP
jgi:hypothetical protein